MDVFKVGMFVFQFCSFLKIFVDNSSIQFRIVDQHRYMEGVRGYCRNSKLTISTYEYR